MMEALLKRGHKKASELEAFLILLTQVNYRDETCLLKDHSLLCRQGESLKSLDTWAKLFHWKKGKTLYYFKKLKRMGMMELMPSDLTTHLRISEYELWTGKGLRKQKEASDEEFDDFWTLFHEITQTDKVNIGRARREWKRLTAEERKLAISQIETYYVSLPNIKYCKQAATYLADKTFLNEYNG